MICYSVTHNRTGTRYIGITCRRLDLRRAEHESHSAHGSRTAFHSALQQKYLIARLKVAGTA